MENDLATKAQREGEINVMMIMMTHYHDAIYFCPMKICQYPNKKLILKKT